jgi:hypothetical protein
MTGPSITSGDSWAALPERRRRRWCGRWWRRPPTSARDQGRGDRLGGRGNMIAQLVEAHGGYELTAVADYFPGWPRRRAGSSASRRRTVQRADGLPSVLESGVEAVFLETPPTASRTMSRRRGGGGACVPGEARGVRRAGVPARGGGGEAGEGRRAVFPDRLPDATDPFFIEGVDRVRRARSAPSAWSAPSTPTSPSPTRPHGHGGEPPPAPDLVNDDGLGGGYLVNAGFHAVDVALWLAGGCRSAPWARRASPGATRTATPMTSTP